MLQQSAKGFLTDNILSASSLEVVFRTPVDAALGDLLDEKERLMPSLLEAPRG